MQLPVCIVAQQCGCEQNKGDNNSKHKLRLLCSKCALITGEDCGFSGGIKTGT